MGSFLRELLLWAKFVPKLLQAHINNFHCSSIKRKKKKNNTMWQPQGINTLDANLHNIIMQWPLWCGTTCSRGVLLGKAPQLLLLLNILDFLSCHTNKTTEKKYHKTSHVNAHAQESTKSQNNTFTSSKQLISGLHPRICESGLWRFLCISSDINWILLCPHTADFTPTIQSFSSETLCRSTQTHWGGVLQAKNIIN